MSDNEILTVLVILAFAILLTPLFIANYLGHIAKSLEEISAKNVIEFHLGKGMTLVKMPQEIKLEDVIKEEEAGDPNV